MIRLRLCDVLAFSWWGLRGLGSRGPMPVEPREAMTAEERQRVLDVADQLERLIKGRTERAHMKRQTPAKTQEACSCGRQHPRCDARHMGCAHEMKCRHHDQGHAPASRCLRGGCANERPRRWIRRGPDRLPRRCLLVHAHP